MKTLTSSLALCAVLTASGAAQAALVDRGGGLIYDTVLKVTWLSDANYAKTSGYDSNGLMTWSQATTWASNLSYYDSVRKVTYTDWRLPTTTDTGAPGAQCTYNGTDCGFNSTGSEMAHLYYSGLDNKGFYNTAGVSQAGGGFINDPLNPNDESLFTNFSAQQYWSGTEYPPGPYSIWSFVPDHVWYFYFGTGEQGATPRTYEMYSLAVRDGDIGAVPVPAAAWLLGSGLLGLAGVARRKSV